jgi:hypothetical protein
MLHNVFTVYDERHLDRLRIWARSWSAQGWTPRLLTARDLGSDDRPRSKSKAIEAAIRKKGGGFYFEDTIINYGWRPGAKPAKVRTYNTRGWMDAALIRFPEDATENFIINCGLSINAADWTI